MSTFDELWPKLARDRRYRAEFVAQHAKQAIPLQIQALMKQFGLTQAQLASRAGLTQGVISRAADPSYGNLSVNTCVRIAGGFDVAFVGEFVPFSYLPRWFDRLYRKSFTVPSFDAENAQSQVRRVALGASLETIPASVLRLATEASDEPSLSLKPIQMRLPGLIVGVSPQAEVRPSVPQAALQQFQQGTTEPLPSAA